VVVVMMSRYIVDGDAGACVSVLLTDTMCVGDAASRMWVMT
jgi:hypothetical protein